MFSLQQNWRTRGQNPGSGVGEWGRGGPNNVYTWVNVEMIKLHEKYRVEDEINKSFES
jgi:hypothetical protein